MAAQEPCQVRRSRPRWSGDNKHRLISASVSQGASEVAATVIKDTPGSCTGPAAAAPSRTPSVCRKACWTRFPPAATCEPWSSEGAQRRLGTLFLYFHVIFLLSTPRINSKTAVK